MDKNLEIKYHQIEEKYWWFVGRRDMIFHILKNLRRNITILDIGCSGGALIQFLNKKGFSQTYGLETSEEAVQLCRAKDIKNIFLMKGNDFDFKDKTFDVIIASDVLEHIEQDELAINAWKQILKPNGKLIIFVPAFNFLWSRHDEVNKHFRRYSRIALLQKIEKTGLKVKYSSYWNIFLFVPIYLSRIIKNKFWRNNKNLGDDFSKVPLLINWLLTHILKIENLIIKRIGAPFGVSLLAVASKI